MSDLILMDAPSGGLNGSNYLSSIKNNTVDIQGLAYTRSFRSVHPYSLSSVLYQTGITSVVIDVESEEVIEKYFLSSPEKRNGLRKITADSIKSPSAVLEVLRWANNANIFASHDAAIDLLAESSDITLEIALYPGLDKLISNKSLAILISGIVRATHIPIPERLQVVLQYIKTEKRIIKESVVDALAFFADEANEKKGYSKVIQICRLYLQRFASGDQPDKFIQRYAKDVIDEL